MTAGVLHDAGVPVWTAGHAPEPSHRAHPKPRYILCALDLKAESRHTLEFAIKDRAAQSARSIELNLMWLRKATLSRSRRKAGLQETAGRNSSQQTGEDPGGGGRRCRNGSGGRQRGGHGSRATVVAMKKRADLVVIGRVAASSRVVAVACAAWAAYAIHRTKPRVEGDKAVPTRRLESRSSRSCRENPSLRSRSVTGDAERKLGGSAEALVPLQQKRGGDGTPRRWSKA